MRTTPAAIAIAAALLAACDGGNVYFLGGSGGTDATGPTTTTSSGDGGQGASDDDGGEGGDDTSTGDGGTGGTGGAGGQGGEEPFLEGAPDPTATPAEVDALLDMFGTDGHRWWFAVDPSEVERMNAKDQGGNPFGDIYTPGQGSASGATYADHVFVTTPGDAPETADYGKVEVRLVGESTFRPWTPDSIPNLRVDTDEFQDDLEIAGYENFRFNNGQVGSIYREEIALEVYTRLGMAAPAASFAWVGSNVWGEDVEVPYTLVEVYKKSFCNLRPELFPDGCENMWEFVGDFGWADFTDPENCQFSSCDATRVLELNDLVMATPPGEGFKEALAGYLDWDAVHRAQCMSWILWTGDDAFHNNNNVVLVERGDGKFQYLPYSIDISGGQDWYQNTPLWGTNTIARGCQSDPTCWADTIAVCEELVDAFTALDPATIVDEVHQRLEDNGMLRAGDEQRYEQVRAWYERRPGDLPGELEIFSQPPCEWPNAICNGECIPMAECIPVCEEPALPCGVGCNMPGECWECWEPFTSCQDGSCRIPGTCPEDL